TRKASGRGPETEISTPRIPFTDDFSDGWRDPFWRVNQTGPDTLIREQGGKLLITLGADAQPGGPFNNIDADWGGSCSLVGDFDMQVRYQLVEWPDANGVSAELDGFFADLATARQDVFNGNQYIAWSNPLLTGSSTTDLSGSLRLARTGSSATSYYRNALGW